MDIDFHYHATYVAAVMAGYTPAEAATIAHAGQYIDDSEPDRLMERSKLGFDPVTTVFTTSQEMSRNRDWSTMTIAHDRAMWTAFHFLPGNIDLRKRYTGPSHHSGIWGQSWKYDELAEQQFKSMCLPDSPMSIKMINDTVQHHADDLHMVGLRMHVLIDTFAHMLYCGSAAWHVNEVEEEPEVWDGKRWLRIMIPPFTYAPPLGFYYNSISYTGHARMGHVPDLPWVKFRYHPKWSSEPIVKDNPRYYLRAFCEMIQAMKCIRERREYVPEVSLPSDSPGARVLSDVEAIIRTVPSDGDQFVWGTLNDFPDQRCARWTNAIPELAKKAKVKLPPPPAYSPDAWLDAARSSANVADTDYAKWHRAAAAHLAFVKASVAEAGLTLLGSAPFVTSEQVAHLMGKNLKIKPVGKAGTYWEVADSSKEPGHAMQLWDDKRSRDALYWVLQYAGAGDDGIDRFEVYNPVLDSFAAFDGEPDASGKQADGIRIKTGKRGSKALQRFPIARHVVKGPGGERDAVYYSLHIANDYAIQPEHGNTGNSTKLVASVQGGDDIRSWRWEFVHQAQPAFPVTLDGVLLAGGFRDAAGLARMDREDKRNTLIVEMTKHSNQPAEYFQGFDDPTLAGKGAVVVLLLGNGLADVARLQQWSDDAQRNTLVTALQKHSKLTVANMHNMSNQDLARVGMVTALGA